MLRSIFSVCICALMTTSVFAQSESILMFVSHDRTYYSEYIVMRTALEAAGYSVDVRNSSGDPSTIYMIPASTDIEATANTLSQSTYADFTDQFQDLFGTTWDANLNPMPATTPVDGRIQDVLNMSGHVALVCVGGTGAIDYIVDGTYAAQGDVGNQVSASDVQASAEKLNDLALEALTDGKPVMAMCHGASLAAYWRIPGTSGPGAETMGYSLLKAHNATGFPESATGPGLISLDVNYREMDPMVISSPHSSFDDDGRGEYKIITTRDWYPQTVAHAARGLLNIIESYPSVEDQLEPVEILVIHGGELDPNNCSLGNTSNDVPCNYGPGPDLPADYTDLVSLLQADSPNDTFVFNVSDLDLYAPLPFNDENQAEIETYLNQFDAVIYFKHWSQGVSVTLQNAMVSYTDNGGGMMALHHGLFNNSSGGENSNIITNDLFGAASLGTTWSGGLETYNMYNTNYGHFVSTFGIGLSQAANLAPGSWSTNPMLDGANSIAS